MLLRFSAARCGRARALLGAESSGQQPHCRALSRAAPQQRRACSPAAALASTARRRGTAVVRATVPRPEDSPFLNSEVVQREAAELFKMFELVSSLHAKFFSFDIEGRRIYLQKSKEFLDKLNTFTFRYRLSDDPVAKDIYGKLTAQLAAAGTTPQGLATEWGRMIEMMEGEVEREAARGVGAAPATPPPGWGSSGPAMADMAALMRDPDVLEALQDPQAVTAARDVAAFPPNLAKYKDNPKLYSLLVKLFFGGQAPR